MPNRLKLIYIIGTFPSLTTTFIAREVAMMRELGAEIQVVSARRPEKNIPLSAQQLELQKGVIYLLPVAWRAFLASHLYFALLRPLAYGGTLLYLLTRPHPGFRSWVKTFFHFNEGVYAAYLIRKRQFDELHAHFIGRAATMALVVGRLLSKPFSISIHAGPDIFVDPVMLGEKISAARHIATCTHYNKTHLETVLKQDLSHKISCLYHGLEISDYQPRETGLAGTPPLIVSVGQLTERKGFRHLIWACRALKDKGYALRCHIIGEGPLRPNLEQLIKQLDVQREVILIGALPHEQVIEQYRQAALFVLPCEASRSGNMDGFPNVLGEAMAMELPVISTRISAVPELVTHNVNGWLAQPGDDESLVAGMETLLNDPALRQRLGKKGRETVCEQFNLRRNIRRFAAALWPAWFSAGSVQAQR